MSKPWKGGYKRTFAESNSEQSASASLAATLAPATQKQSGKRWKPAEAVEPDDAIAAAATTIGGSSSSSSSATSAAVDGKT